MEPKSKELKLVTRYMNVYEMNGELVGGTLHETYEEAKANSKGLAKAVAQVTFIQET